MLQAERQPLVGYSDRVDKAWAAKIEGDILLEQPSPSRVPAAIGACVAAAFIVLFVGGREPLVAALPDLAGLYETVGIPVNLDGLVIEEVEAERPDAADDGRLALRGAIRNVSGADKALAPLTARLYDMGGTPAGTRAFDPPVPLIAAGESASFHVEFDSVPDNASEIVIRFRRSADVGPSSVESRMALQ